MRRSQAGQIVISPRVFRHGREQSLGALNLKGFNQSLTRSRTKAKRLLPKASTLPSASAHLVPLLTEPPQLAESARHAPISAHS
jgi:hypothetical protein